MSWGEETAMRLGSMEGIGEQGVELGFRKVDALKAKYIVAEGG